MRRIFPILATVVGLSLMSGYGSGLFSRSDDPGRLARLGGAASALAVHAMAFVYLLTTSRQVEAASLRERLPEWVGAQAEKNWRKGLIYQVPGLAIAAVGAGLVGFEWWHPLVWGSSVSFQIGAFLGETAIIAAQARLLGDVRGWAGSSRPTSDP